MRMRIDRIVGVVAALSLVASLMLLARGGQATAEPNAFQRTWMRTDKPVVEHVATRTWMWGPQETAIQKTERYDQAPNHQRTVLYFEKSRMEITHPDAFDDGVWYVTNGLLVRE